MLQRSIELWLFNLLQLSGLVGSKWTSENMPHDNQAQNDDKNEEVEQLLIFLLPCLGCQSQLVHGVLCLLLGIFHDVSGLLQIFTLSNKLLVDIVGNEIKLTHYSCSVLDALFSFISDILPALQLSHYSLFFFCLSTLFQLFHLKSFRLLLGGFYLWLFSNNIINSLIISIVDLEAMFLIHLLQFLLERLCSSLNLNKFVLHTLRCRILFLPVERFDLNALESSYLLL